MVLLPDLEVADVPLIPSGQVVAIDTIHLAYGANAYAVTLYGYLLKKLRTPQ